MRRVIDYIISTTVKTRGDDFDTKPAVRALEELASNALDDGLLIAKDDTRSDVDLLKVEVLAYPNIDYSLAQAAALASTANDGQETCDADFVRSLVACSNAFELAAAKFNAMSAICKILCKQDDARHIVGRDSSYTLLNTETLQHVRNVLATLKEDPE